MPNFKSHFEFDNQQRSGILLLCFLIVGLFCVLYFCNDVYVNERRVLGLKQINVLETKADISWQILVPLFFFKVHIF